MDLRKRASELRDEVEVLETDLRHERAKAEKYRRGLVTIRGLLCADMDQRVTLRLWHEANEALGEDPIDELIKERDAWT
jgi:hypothetical protein